MQRVVAIAVSQAHLIWLVSIVNVGIGFVIPGFNPYAQRISQVALEAPVFAYTHRAADIVIGLSMCAFALGIQVASRKRLSFAMLSMVLLGVSFISAGIWTLESRLHELYGLSIFMIIVPIAFALEFKNTIHSEMFEYTSLAVSFLHVFMFWIIYAGFTPHEYSGLIQRLWAIPTMGWFGIAALVLARAMPADGMTRGAGSLTARRELYGAPETN